MKKALSILLTIALLAVCFTACSESPAETKTDAKPVENANSVVVSQVEGSADDTVQPTPEEGQPDQNSAPAQQQEQTNEPSPPAQQPVSTPNQPTTTVTPEKIHGADIEREYPTFVSEQALQTWLQKGSGAYEKDRSDYLMQAKNKGSIAYYHPSEELLTIASLDQIKIHTPSQAHIYYYSLADGTKFNIVVENAQIPGFYENDEPYLETQKQGYLAGEKGYGYYQNAKSSIEVYWAHGDFDTHVVWLQYGLVHRATITGHDNIAFEKILPYLALEQVTVNLNSDHVTQ